MMNLRPFACSVLVAATGLSGAAETRSEQPRQIGEPPMSYKGEPLPDEYWEYTRTREISRNAQGKQPGIYPLSAQLLLGIDRNALERNTETGLLHAGNLNFLTLPASVLRHLPMVKKDYPEIFE